MTEVEEDVEEMVEAIKNNSGWVTIKIAWAAEFGWVVSVLGRYREFKEQRDAYGYAACVMMKATMLAPIEQGDQKPDLSDPM